MKYLFFISLIGIFYTFIGYPISLFFIDKFLKKRKNKKDNYMPRVSFIIAAHNEARCIEKKLRNTLDLEYPKDKLEIIVASDNSTDNTNLIVEEFIKKHKDYTIILYKVKERKGKTNAQNEAIDISGGEIIAFSDANSIWERNALTRLIQNFIDEKVDYVCGRLVYINSLDNITSNSESTYWNYDLWMRKIESGHGNITAGNGAIYAIRKKNIVKIPEISCHDGAYPTIVSLNNKRAVYEDTAIAYEKAGENTTDEFGRKIRMSRGMLTRKYTNLQKYNPFKVGIYSYFYFCHRYLRYSLYLFHILLFVSSCYLYNYIFFRYCFFAQCIFYIFALLGRFFKIKIFYFPYYYTMTIIAQFIGVIKDIFGLNKPFWEKAESTR